MRGQADPKFRAEIAALIDARHRAFLNGEPGDGLAVEGAIEVLESVEVRVGGDAPA